MGMWGHTHAPKGGGISPDLLNPLKGEDGVHTDVVADLLGEGQDVLHRRQRGLRAPCGERRGRGDPRRGGSSEGGG